MLFKKNKLLIKIFLFFVLSIFLVITSISLAQEKNATNSTTQSATIDEEKVKALKEKLATKVAEMRDSQTRGFSGEIAQLNKTSFTMVTLTSEVKIKYSDDVLIFKKSGSQQIEGKITDLKNTNIVSVLGIYDKEINQATAKVIFLESAANFYTGKIVIVDANNGVITIKSATNKDNDIEYEKNTIAQEYKNTDNTVIKSGLSRLKPGDRIYVWGSLSEEDNQKISALKILRLPADLFNQTEVSSASPEATVSASPKSSPTSTLKP